MTKYNVFRFFTHHHSHFFCAFFVCVGLACALIDFWCVRRSLLLLLSPALFTWLYTSVVFSATSRFSCCFSSLSPPSSPNKTCLFLSLFEQRDGEEEE